jgi:hypothetical protein
VLIHSTSSSLVCASLLKIIVERMVDNDQIVTRYMDDKDLATQRLPS